MATIKSYTDPEQSRKLAERLPLESADGGWYGTNNPFAANTTYWLYTKYTERAALPCWSLAALFGVLPHIDIEKKIYSDDTYGYRIKAYIRDGYIGDWYDNPVDACYDMIMRLNELNLL